MLFSVILAYLTSFLLLNASFFSENGSDLEERSPKRLFTALHLAALYGHHGVLQLLLSHEADVNSRDKTESTPLHAASQGGHLAAVMLLLQEGANPLHYGASP